MLDPIQRRLVAILTWPQFLDLLDRLGIDPLLFTDSAIPAQRARDFNNQLQLLATSRSLDYAAAIAFFTEALHSILGAATSTALVKVTPQFILRGLDELLVLAKDPARQAAVLRALAPAKNSLDELAEGLVTMSRCKEAHAALHDLSFKIPLLQNAARDWKKHDPSDPLRGRLTFELRRVSGACLDDIQRFSHTIRQLPPPSDTIFGNIADLMHYAICEVRDSIDHPAGDPEAPVTSILQPNVRQEPSKLQNLIALHASSLPFDQVIASFNACDFPSRDDALAALAGLRDGTAGIESQHHDWQFVNNQIRGMEEPLEVLEGNDFNRRVAEALLRPLRLKLDTICGPQPADPLNSKILCLGKAVSDQLADPASDLWSLRADFDEFLRLISSRFYTIDENLLDACRDMEPLCAPLRRLSNLI